MKRFHVLLPVMGALVIGLGSPGFAQSPPQTSPSSTTPVQDPWGSVRSPGASMTNPGTSTTGPKASKTNPAAAGTAAQTPKDQMRAERRSQRMADRKVGRSSCRDQAKQKSIAHEAMRDFMKTCMTSR